MRARHFIISESELFEINMSPGNLKKLASKIDARVGMEFEMIVPGVEVDDSGDMEPDYSNDERVRGWSSVEQFFDDGDYNSRRAIQDLHNELSQEYTESEYWQEAEQSWWEENEEYYVEQAVEKELGEDLWQQASEQLGNKKFADERDRKNAIQEIYSTLVSNRRDESIENQDEIYGLARDEAMEESEPDHDTGFDRFLRGTYSYMNEIESNFSHIVTWPYWESSGGDSEVDIGTVANNFSPYVNMKVNHSQSYHGGKRTADAYVVEPDSSLTGDNAGDSGLEFVSPPLTLEQMGKHLEGVKEFARDYNCYTNRTTGLHINVSVPNMTLENLDYVKLALLLGDKYVLEQFGRSANTYCKSAMTEILSRAKSNRNIVPGLLDMMKNGLNKMASKMIHSGVTGKYTSINTKDKYIEFRSPGGDWLNEDLDKIVATMNRFAVALDAAVDPEKYKEEYSKKLYKVIAPEDANDTIKYFSRYVAGDMPKAALKSFLKQAKLEREVKRKPDSGKLYWWNVKVVGSGGGAQVVAPSAEEAIDAAIATDRAFAQYNRGAFSATVMRPYEGPTTRQSDARPSSTTGHAQPQEQPRRQDGSMTAPESDPDANFAVIRSSDNAVINYFTRNTRVEADQAFTRWLASQGLAGNPSPGYYLIAVRPRRDSASQTGGFTGQWIIKVDGEAVHRFGGVGNVQADANRVAQQWMRDQISRGTLALSSGAEVEVVPEMQ